MQILVLCPIRLRDASNLQTFHLRKDLLRCPYTWPVLFIYLSAVIIQVVALCTEISAGLAAGCLIICIPGCLMFGWRGVLTCKRHNLYWDYDLLMCISTSCFSGFIWIIFYFREILSNSEVWVWCGLLCCGCS
jgi:hypothetical protein